jgi:hypothetical protein
MTEGTQVRDTADRLRDGFLLTIRELDRRREEAMDLKLQLTRHWPLAAGLVLGVGVLAAGFAVLVVTRIHGRPHRLRVARRDAVLRAWRHPERMASRAKEPPFGTELARRVGMAFVMTLAVRTATGLAKRLAPAKLG